MTNINKLDQAIKTLIMNDGVDFDTLQKFIDNQEIVNEMPKYKQDLLFSKLILDTQSLGSLLFTKLRLNNISADALAKQLGVAPNFITDLIADKVVPNKVPLLLMKRILNDFQLTFREVEKAMDKTFSMFLNQPNYVLTAAKHRKGANGRFVQTETSSNVCTEDVRDRYISELRQLMAE